MKKNVQLYEYKNCSTCKKAIQFLEKKKVEFDRIPIVDEPPTVAELKKMLAYLKEDGGSIKNLFNTSGEQYRALGISEKLKEGMTEKEALELLSKNGKLIKRPFILTQDTGLVGFKEEAWKKIF